MSDRANELPFTRPALPFIDRHGNTVSIRDGEVHVHMTTGVLSGCDALDLSAALAVAVQHIATHNHTTLKEANHG